MATYDDFKRVLKDTIQVDMKQRYTPQEVKFINRNNEFYGTFKGLIESGQIDVSAFNAISAEIANIKIGTAEIDSANIKNLSANGIDLSKYGKYINDLSTELKDLEIYTYSADKTLSSAISSVREQVKELSSSARNIDNDLQNEKFTRQTEDTKLGNRINDLTEHVDSEFGKTNKKLDDFIEEQKDTTEETRKQLKGYSDENKHYVLNTVAKKTDRTFKMQEFASNTLDVDIPYAYMRLNGDGEEREVGKITNCIYEEQLIEGVTKRIFKSFTLTIFGDCETHFLDARPYNFDSEHVTYVTGKQKNYEIKWDAGKADTIELLIEGKKGIKHIDLYLGDNDVGDIAEYVKGTTSLLSGIAKFQNATYLPTFAGQYLTFNDTVKSMEFVKDGKKHSITYNDDDTFTLLENISIRKYHQLRCGDVEFGRIYEGDVKYNDDGSVAQIKPLISAYVGLDKVVRTFDLNMSNGFKDEISELKYVQLSSESIAVVKEEKYYQFNTYLFNESESKVLGRIGQLKVFEANVSDVSSSKITKLTLVLEDGELVGEYELLRVGTTNNFKYVGKKDGQTLILKYDSVYDKYLLHYIYKDIDKTIGSFYVAIDEISVYKDESEVYFTSAKIFNSEGKVEFDKVDMGETVVYTVTFDMNDEKSTEILDTYLLKQDKNGNVITVEIPKVEYAKKSREFILNLKISGFDETNGTWLKFYSGVENCKFIFNKKDVTGDKYDNKFILNQSESCFKFTEIERGLFEIEDINNQNIFSKNITTNNVFAENGEIKKVSSDYIYAEHAFVKHLTSDIQLSVEDLGVNDLSAYRGFMVSCTTINGIVVNQTVEKENVNEISTYSDKLYFKNVSCSFDEICSSIDQKLTDHENRLSTLSDDVEFLLSTGHETMSYFGSIKFYDHAIPGHIIEPQLSDVLEYTFGKDKFFKQGFTYRISSDYQYVWEGAVSSVFGKNDYFVFKRDAFIQNAKMSDLDTFRDAQKEFEILSVEFDTKLRNAIESLDVESQDLSTVAKLITSLSETDGKIEYTTKLLVSSDVSGLSDYVTNEINLSVEALSTTEEESGKIVSKIIQKSGIVSAEFTKITNDHIEDESISQNKIINLSSDLNNISSEISSLDSDTSTISANLSGLSSEYRKFYDNTFKQFDEETHISSHGLIITDEEHPKTEFWSHDRYVMTFLSGTIVLKKIK